jgi:hypothetical protein
MFRRKMTWIGSALLAFVTSANAQVPQNQGRVQFVPIDTTKNLATPVPAGNLPVGQPRSYFDRLLAAIRGVWPFGTSTSRQAFMAGPQVPVTRLPQPTPSNLPQPQTPRTQLPSIPSIPPIVSGTIR